MIRAEHLTKRFDDFVALQDLNCRIPEGCIYGLVGSNGAGKSTFLRLLTGIYRPDAGGVYFDDAPVYENPMVKNQFTLVPDELYFLPQANMLKMEKLYAAVYPGFSRERFRRMTDAFGLDPRKNIGTFSKGMRRQAATILALSARPKYIFFDETFDGLDPVMRNLVRNVIYSDVCERRSTAVITSHSLRELEDTCDQLALLHKGGILFESDIEHLKTSLFKVQAAFDGEYGRERFAGIDIVNFSKKGTVATLIVRGDREKTAEKFRALGPVLLDILPLSLEEVFLYEMDALGYTFPDVLAQEDGHESKTL